MSNTKKVMAALGLVALAVVAVLLLTSGGGKSPPYPTLHRPPLSGQVTASSCPHVMGGCLPHPVANNSLGVAPPASGVILGPDFSNNDPVRLASAWAIIAAHNQFAYLKSIEGTGFYDTTAAPMSDLARAEHLPVGGYDFTHLCLVPAGAEAAFFVRSLKVQRLLGVGTMAPAADVEYGNGSCNGRTWLQTWVADVYAQDGHICPIVYTGAWFWQPNLGSYWPTCQGHEVQSWISGYNVSYPYMPSGLHHLDFWQYADNGFNGYDHADYSKYRNGVVAFEKLLNNPAPPKPKPCFGPHADRKSARCQQVRADVNKWSHARDATLRAIVRTGCSAQPVPFHPTYAQAQAYLKTVHNRPRVCRVLRQRANYFATKVHTHLH